jgi:protein required for attachment to host cells
MRLDKRRTWLLIADGSRAKVFESSGAHEALNEIDDMAVAIDLPKSGDLLADRPGRTFDSVGAACHAKENPTDPPRRNFAGKVVDELRRAMLAKRFDWLILVAPPGSLGDLRQELPKGLKDKLVDEITSDLTNMPQQQLQTHLKDHPRSIDLIEKIREVRRTALVLSIAGDSHQ